jgi:hypothetical protein
MTNDLTKPERQQAATLDALTLERLLDWDDIGFVRRQLGWRAAAGRWRTQLGLFAQLYGDTGRTAKALIGARLCAQSSPLDIQIKDSVAIAWWMSVIASLAAAHFAGVPLGQQLRRAHGRVLAMFY